MYEQVWQSLQDDGILPTILKGKSYLFNRYGSAETRSIFDDYQNILNQNGLNLCNNKYIPEQYKPHLDNILLATESPGYVKNGYSHNKDGWIQDDMEFIAEISWEKYTHSELQYIPRDIYTTHDGLVNFNPRKDYNKTEVISMIYSDKRYLEGQKFRHEISDKFNNEIDTFGSGTGSFLEQKVDSLADYRFQVAIENVNHDNYVSEKFFDCLKTSTVPVYRGGTKSIKKLGFDFDGILTFETVEDLDEILDNVSKDTYIEMTDSVEYNRHRLLELRKKSKFQFYLGAIQPRHMPSTYPPHTGAGASDSIDPSLIENFKDILSESYRKDLNLSPDE